MIKININKAYIPIPFVNDENETVFELRFYKTDENLQRLLNYNDEMKEIDKSDEGNLEIQRKQIQEIVDATLGEGSFDKIYALDKSVLNVANYYTQIVAGILTEMGYGEVAQTLDTYRGG